MFTNLTPHAINIATETDSIEIPPSGEVARVSTTPTPVGSVSGIPIVTVEYGDAVLPVAPDDDGPFIVSTIFATAYFAQNPDSEIALYVPDSGPTAIREDGRIVAVRSLIRKTARDGQENGDWEVIRTEDLEHLRLEAQYPGYRP